MTRAIETYKIRKADYSKTAFITVLPHDTKCKLAKLLERCSMIELSITRLFLYIGPDLKHPQTGDALFSALVLQSVKDTLCKGIPTVRDEIFMKFMRSLSHAMLVLLDVVVLIQHKPESSSMWDVFEEDLYCFMNKLRENTLLKVTNSNIKRDLPAGGELMLQHFFMARLVARDQLMAFGIPQTGQSKVYTFKEAFNG